MNRTVALSALALVLVACKNGPGAPGGGTVALKDAPPPTLPAGWVPAPTDTLGYTIAFPEGWSLGPAERSKVEEYVKALNDKAWGSLGEKKAEVDFDRASYVMGGHSVAGDPLDPSGFKYATQYCLILREELGRTASYSEAKDRWFDTMKESTDGKELKRKDVELPVGLAASLTKSHTGMGMVDRTAVYCLVDGETFYTFFFEEEASGDVPPIPIQQILETFRVKK